MCFFILLGVIFSFVSAEEPAAEKRLTLKDAIFQALKSNLDLQIEKTTTQLALETLKINNSLFIPTLQLDGGMQKSLRPSVNIYQGVDTVETTTKEMTFTIGENLPTGGRLSIFFYNSLDDTNSLDARLDPSYSAYSGIRLTQPLLKGIGSLATKYQIYIASNNVRMSKYQLQARIAQLVYDVEAAYWELVYAHQNMGATKMSLKRAQDWLTQNELKVKVGTAAPIEILSSKAQVASNESSMIRAEQAIQSREEALKRILNMSQDTSVILPVDQPEVKSLDVNFDSFLQEALQNRLDIKQAQLTVDNNQLQVKYAKNQALPTLQLSANYSTYGTGGTFWKIPDNLSPFDPDFKRIQVDKTTLGDAWREVFKMTNKNYSVSLSLQVPLWMKREKAELSQAKINRERSRLQLQNTENMVYSEVKEIVKEFQSSLKLVDAEKIALQLEEENLKAEEKRLAVGLSTNFNVLDYQRRVATAQSSMLRSVIDYSLTQARINRILNRTFQVYGINFGEFYEK